MDYIGHASARRKVVNESTRKEVTMTKAFIFSDWLAIPSYHNPSMHDLFYRVEAYGQISLSAYKCGYMLTLKRNDCEKTMTAVRDSFYECLHDIYRRLIKERKKNGNTSRG